MYRGPKRHEVVEDVVSIGRPTNYAMKYMC
jgi:hypothetical protein